MCMNAQNRDIFSVNAVFSIWILFFLRRVFFRIFVACWSLGINILLQDTKTGVDKQIYYENTPTLNKVYFIKYKTRANYFITRLLHGIKCGQKLTTDNLTHTN